MATQDLAIGWDQGQVSTSPTLELRICETTSRGEDLMSIANDVFYQALGLPVQQREELALLLWESLPEDERPLTLDPEYEAEVLRRAHEVGSGRAKTLTLEEVMARLRKSSSAQTSS